MRIGIDIDGVLTNIQRFLYDYGTKFSYENNCGRMLNPNDYSEKVMFGWSDEKEEKFWNEYLEFYATEYPARSFAAEVIHKLKEDGHEIYIVTARNEDGLPPKSYGKMKDFVLKWLEDNKIEYDKIIYTQGNKLPYCIGNYIDVMIEDCAEQVKNISEKVKVLCYDVTYNRGIEGKNITRVYGWYDIYDKIKENRYINYIK